MATPSACATILTPLGACHWAHAARAGPPAKPTPRRAPRGVLCPGCALLLHQPSHAHRSRRYADKWVTGALTAINVDYTNLGDTNFASVPDVSTDDEKTREQAVKKGTVYLNIWMYALHEFEAAIVKCDPASTDQNEAAAHAWDEESLSDAAWANTFAQPV